MQIKQPNGKSAVMSFRLLPEIRPDARRWPLPGVCFQEQVCFHTGKGIARWGLGMGLLQKVFIGPWIEQLPAFAPWPGAQVHQPVCVWLSPRVSTTSSGITCIPQFPQSLYQAAVVAFDAAYTRLVKNIQNVDQGRSYLRGQPYRWLSPPLSVRVPRSRER